MTLIDDAITRADALYKVGQWDSAYNVLWGALGNAGEERDSARLSVSIVDGLNHEDFERGLQHRWDKDELLDRIDSVALSTGDEHLRAEVLHLRGVALHIDFIMATGDLEREETCFTEAAEIFEKVDDNAGSALAIAFLGICYHVALGDRDRARPVLARALAQTDEELAPIAHSEATRHLGLIARELDDPTNAMTYLEDSLRVRSESGWSCLIPSALHVIAAAKLGAGDLDGARSDLVHAKELAEPLDAQLTLALIAKTEADLQMARLAPGVWQRAHP